MITIYDDEATKAIWKAIKKLAAKEGKTASALAREALKEYLKRHGSGNPAYSLDPWGGAPEFRAYPALASDWGEARLAGFTDKDLRHMANKAREALHFTEQEGRKRRILV